jgi:hypothetical protein
MKKKIYFTLIFGAFAVGAALGQVSGPEVGIEVSYPDKISSHLRTRIDSTIEVTVARFNAENHLYKITTPNAVDRPCINVDFSKAKLATKTQRNIAYVINLLAPVYVPTHKMNSNVTFSSGAQVNGNYSTVVKSSTMVLLANIHKREDKLLQKYALKLYDAFVEMNLGIQRDIAGYQTKTKVML